MAGKPEFLRALEGLQQDCLKEVKAFIDSLKKHNGKGHAIGRNEDALAKGQPSAINEWAARAFQA